MNFKNVLTVTMGIMILVSSIVGISSHNFFLDNSPEDMLLDKPKNKQSKIITPAIHAELEQRVNDPHYPFLCYWGVQDGVQQEFGLEII